jgi:hypothetical protein
VVTPRQARTALVPQRLVGNIQVSTGAIARQLLAQVRHRPMANIPIATLAIPHQLQAPRLRIANTLAAIITTAPQVQVRHRQTGNIPLATVIKIVPQHQALGQNQPMGNIQVDTAIVLILVLRHHLMGNIQADTVTAAHLQPRPVGSIIVATVTLVRQPVTLVEHRPIANIPVAIVAVPLKLQTHPPAITLLLSVRQLP